MKDMQAHLEKLRSDAAECALISNLATNLEKERVVHAARRTSDGSGI